MSREHEIESRSRWDYGCEISSDRAKEIVDTMEKTGSILRKHRARLDFSMSPSGHKAVLQQQGSLQGERRED